MGVGYRIAFPTTSAREVMHATPHLPHGDHLMSTMLTGANPIEREVAKAEVTHRARTILVPVLYIVGAALVYKAGGQWWPWMALGVLMWAISTFLVLRVSEKAAEYRKRKARGEVWPR